MMGTLARSVVAACFCLALLLAPSGSVAGGAKDTGHVEPGDFSCRGVFLGDGENKLLASFGEPLYDKQISVYGMAVVYYSFGRDLEVGVSARTRKVVDLLVRDRKYRARSGVRYGATPYKIRAVYGEKERTMLDGVIFYIYDHPQKKGERLLLEVDPEDGHLLSFRMTSLPLTEEEADAMAEEDVASNDLSVLLAGEKEIDTSAMPKHEPVKIRGLEK